MLVTSFRAMGKRCLSFHSISYFFLFLFKSQNLITFNVLLYICSKFFCFSLFIASCGSSSNLLKLLALVATLFNVCACLSLLNWNLQ